MAEFFAMGGYAFYVWTSYLIVLVLFLWHYFGPVVKVRSILRELSMSNSGDSSNHMERQ